MSPAGTPTVVGPSSDPFSILYRLPFSILQPSFPFCCRHNLNLRRPDDTRETYVYRCSLLPSSSHLFFLSTFPLPLFMFAPSFPFPSPPFTHSSPFFHPTFPLCLAFLSVHSGPRVTPLPSYFTSPLHTLISKRNIGYYVRHGTEAFDK